MMMMMMNDLKYSDDCWSEKWVGEGEESQTQKNKKLQLTYSSMGI